MVTTKLRHHYEMMVSLFDGRNIEKHVR
jgi:hypothetical protein